MGKIEKISAGMSAFAQSLASLAKVALLSRRPSVAVTAGKDEELVVLGNGPSLNDTVADHSDFLASRRLLAVNFAAPISFMMCAALGSPASAFWRKRKYR